MSAAHYISGTYSESPSFETLAEIVLRAVERRPLSLKDLSYIVGTSGEADQATEEVRPIMQRLLSMGLITEVNSGVLGYLWPFSKTAKLAVDPDTAFTLTAKGNFHLHPIFNEQGALR